MLKFGYMNKGRLTGFLAAIEHDLVNNVAA